MTALLAQLSATSATEWVALASGIGYALLAVLHNRWAWLFGAVSSGTLAWLAAHQALPMQAAMQVAYVGFAVYGFWRWTAVAADNLPPVVTWPLARHLLAVVAVAVASFLLAPTLVRYTGAAWPRLDTAVMLASLLATWMTAASKLENWIYWIIIDLASMLLYGAQGLVLAALLYAIYVVIAVIGLRSWWRRWSAARGAT